MTHINVFLLSEGHARLATDTAVITRSGGEERYHGEDVKPQVLPCGVLAGEGSAYVTDRVAEELAFIPGFDDAAERLPEMFRAYGHRWLEFADRPENLVGTMTLIGYSESQGSMAFARAQLWRDDLQSKMARPVSYYASDGEPAMLVADALGLSRDRLPTAHEQAEMIRAQHLQCVSTYLKEEGRRLVQSGKGRVLTLDIYPDRTGELQDHGEIGGMPEALKGLKEGRA